MKKSLFVKSGLLAGVCALMLAGSAKAADLATAAGIMAEVEATAVDAKASIAAAAVGGDTATIAQAQQRSNAIDTALANARAAYNAVEANVNSGDTGAADRAEEALIAAQTQVQNAAAGVTTPTVASDTAGSRPGSSDDPPNIEEVPWKSQGIKAYYQSLFGTFWNTSSFGHGQDYGDRMATPE